MLADLKANRFKDAQAVYDDLNLIFLNALHYNIEDSQIAKDANTLKVRPWPWARWLAVTRLTRTVLFRESLRQSGPNDLHYPLLVVKHQ